MHSRFGHLREAEVGDVGEHCGVDQLPVLAKPSGPEVHEVLGEAAPRVHFDEQIRQPDAGQEGVEALREQEIRLGRGLEQFSESVRDSLREPSFETKQQVLRLLVDRILGEDHKVVIRHVVPTGPVGLQTEQRP